MPATQLSTSAPRSLPFHGLRRDDDGWLRPLEVAQPRPRPRTRERSSAQDAVSPRPAAVYRERGFPRIELLRSPSVLLVRVALPGVGERDLRVRLEQSDLVIEGEVRPAGGEAGCRSLLSEWSYGPFHRRVQLGVAVDPAAMRTELREGLLRIEIDLTRKPRPEHATPDC